MKHLFLSIIAIAIAGNVQAQLFGNKKVKGNGNVVKITRTTPDYDGIKCSGSFDYVLVAGTEGSITIEGEENLLEYIITEVKGNNLVVRTENNVNLQTGRNKNIKITIPFKDISSVSLAGSGDLWTESVINTSGLSVSLAGSGDIKLDVKAETVKSSLAGSGDIELKGSTNTLDVSVAGSGDFEGFGLQANDTKVSVAGSGDAQVVSNETLKANVAGSGSIKYKGNPKKEDSKVAGSGSIRKD